ncbi:ATP-dependent protease ATPase subunit HslU [Acetobacterium woodii]|uniref:ATP-dependent protease, ATP-binding subunit HslU n=1 Tax=Acetobacterium woodii (strain ATCC 29683 / DSM 1030 / JCM 2381 / KCTC 1655 / WB1) TaxID=931626 RepID=H6LJW3_ACEWD|nr:ATP-dependent protease ATPase subunit HslU [Acetobacterium woodii]AFA48717.1 ATP-dependent protease, ATP-binding subunit HslU [Acetobacterium woodii DSM 1030]
MKELTPKKIVTELNRYIIGQQAAKKAVAVALRNRYRRSLLPADLIDEFTPKNIILIGPTGVGKTEIARRMAKLIKAPFIKVEATKFTEVGYVGRDVESMVRDLVSTSIRNVQQEKMKEVYVEAEKNANKIILDVLVPSKKIKETLKTPFDIFMKPTPPSPPTQNELAGDTEKEQSKKEKREALSKELEAGALEDQMIEIEVDDDGSKTIGIMQGMNSDSMSFNMNDILGDFMPQKKKKKNVKISEARKILINQEAQKLIDMDQVNELGIQDAEQNGIIFIDEIDKIIGNGNNQGPDVSREGVQRDILPIVEGSTINTKYGPIKTDYILFIGAGAFHVSKIADMIPELQGRFPISVQLDSLTEEDFIEILTHTENSVIKQYQELIRTEDIDLIFEDEAIKYIAKIAYLQNEEDENIGARRLHTVMEKLLEEISFYASDYEQSEFTIDLNYAERIFHIADKHDNYQKYLL